MKNDWQLSPNVWKNSGRKRSRVESLNRPVPERVTVSIPLVGHPRIGTTSPSLLVQALVFALLLTMGLAGCASHADYVALRKEVRGMINAQRDLQTQQETLRKQIETLESRLEKSPSRSPVSDLSRANQEQINQLTLQVEKLETRLAEARVSPPVQAERDEGTSREAGPSEPVEEPVTPMESNMPEELETLEEPEKPLSTSRIGGVGPTAAFRAAYNDYLSGRFDLAVTGFRRFLVDFPFTSLTPRVLYYLGETYHSMDQQAKAIQAFQRVIEDYPDSDKTPVALFKLGLLMVEAGESSKARTYFQQVTDQYPTSDEARLAEQELSRLP